MTRGRSVVFSVSTINKTDPHDITELLLKVALSLIPALCNEVPVARQESDQSCICELGVSILLLFTICLIGFRCFDSVLFFVYHFIHYTAF